MKIFRVIAADEKHVQTIYILAKNAKKAKEVASQYGFSNFLFDAIYPTDTIEFWDSLSNVEQKQFERALVNNFFKKEIL